jgi:hypothetical protein
VNTKGASVPIFTGNHGVMMMGGHLGTLFLDLQLFFMIISKIISHGWVDESSKGYLPGILMDEWNSISLKSMLRQF